MKVIKRIMTGITHWDKDITDIDPVLWLFIVGLILILLAVAGWFLWAAITR